MKVAILGLVHDKYWETNLFIKSCHQFYPDFDVFIFCNADSSKIKPLFNSKIIQVPNEKTYNLKNIPGSGYEYYFQVGAVTTTCYAETYIKNMGYDYIILIPTDCIFVTDIIFERLKDIKNNNLDCIMGKWNNSSYGASIQKENINIYNLDTMIENWRFNGEQTVTKILNNYNVKYIDITCKFGYFTVYGVIHFDTNIVGGKELYQSYIKDNLLFYDKNKYINYDYNDFFKHSLSDDFGRKHFLEQENIG